VNRSSSLSVWADKVASLLDSMPSTTVGWPLPITHELTVREDTPTSSREAVTLG
jgi:hypothetical protein